MASKESELRADVSELQRLIDLTPRQSVKNYLFIQIKKLESELTLIRESAKTEEKPAKSNPSGPGSYDVKITNYAWDQSDKFVKIFVTLNDVHTIPEENLKCTFENNGVSLIVRDLHGKNFNLNLKNLLQKIDGEKSYIKVKTDMVVVFVNKVASSKWSNLLSSDVKAPATPPPAADPENPTDGLMQIMKKMYDEGDDDLKRTIAKAWTEGRSKEMPV